MKDPDLLMSPPVARRVLLGCMLFLIVVQVVMVAYIGTRPDWQGISKFGDPFAEGNALRASQAYMADGLTAHHGLPRIIYGQSYPEFGWPSNHNLTKLTQAQRNEWTYRHYPPGPDLMLGAMASILGLNHIWVLRLFPILTGLLCVGVFFSTLAKYLGSDRAAVLAVACAALPTLSMYMACLHYQGYSLSLLLLQMALLIRVLWGAGPVRYGAAAAFFALGFFQGWLSFDQCFVVTFLAVPFWLIRRAEGPTRSWRWMVLTVVLTGGGFTFAHGLHFLQVVGEAGSARAALADLGSSATYYGTGFVGDTDYAESTGGVPGAPPNYFQQIEKGFGVELRRVVHPALDQRYCTISTISAALAAMLLLAIVSMVSRAWNVPRGYRWGAAAACLLSAAWALAQPVHARVHLGMISRHYFVLYFCAVLALVRYWHRTPALTPHPTHEATEH